MSICLPSRAYFFAKKIIRIRHKKVNFKKATSSLEDDIEVEKAGAKYEFDCYSRKFEEAPLPGNIPVKEYIYNHLASALKKTGFSKSTHEVMNFLIDKELINPKTGRIIKDSFGSKEDFVNKHLTSQEQYRVTKEQVIKDVPEIDDILKVFYEKISKLKKEIKHIKKKEKGNPLAKTRYQKKENEIRKIEKDMEGFELLKKDLQTIIAKKVIIYSKAEIEKLYDVIEQAGKIRKYLFIINSPGEMTQNEPLIEELLKRGCYQIVIGTSDDEARNKQVLSRINKLQEKYPQINIAYFDRGMNLKNIDDIDMVVTGLFHEKNNKTLEMARRKNIPIIGIVDLTPATEDSVGIAVFKHYYFAAQKCTRILVGNKAVFTEFVDAYESKSATTASGKVVIGKDPKWEQSAAKINSDKRLKDILEIKEDEIIISFASQLTKGSYDQKAALNSIAEALGTLLKDERYKDKKIRFLYVVHGRENANDLEDTIYEDEYMNWTHVKTEILHKKLKSIYPEYEERIKINIIANLTYEAIAISDVHLAQTSTTLIEAAYAGIPVFSVVDDTLKANIPVYNDNIIKNSTDSQEIYKNIVEFTSKNAQKNKEDFSKDVKDSVVGKKENKGYVDLITEAEEFED